MPSFDLLNDPWIPALHREGVTRPVGIRPALLDAHKLERITEVSPLAEVAIHRLLLAVLHRALDGPADSHDALDLYQAGRFPKDRLESYFRRWGNRFDLFDPDVPFYQVPDLPDDGPLPWTKLLPEVASGHNPTLFSHAFDDHPPLASPGEIAIALIIHQTFTPGGLIRRLGVTAGKAGPLAAAAVFLPQGVTLFETLLLNLAPYDGQDDEPIWERDPFQPSDVEGGRTQAMVSGRTRIYTWLSRSIRLLPERDGSVRFVAYGPGVFPHEGPDLDPMCAYRRSNGSLLPYRLRVDRGFWRDFEAVLPASGATAASDEWRPPFALEHARKVLGNRNLTTLLFPLVVGGQITDQAKVLDVRREVYPLSVRALEPDAAGCIRRALRWAAEVGEALNRAGWTLAANLLFPGMRPLAEDVRRALQSLPLHSAYWSRLEVEFPAFLDRLTQMGLEAAERTWREVAQEAARQAWRRTSATVGSGPRHLKAIAEGERTLAHGIRRLSA